ncbi:MAG: Omp28-related outer membrane protein [Ignavibacteriae bacterium]|nr:Omp28-related outer membrane protein [Ignavibacteriota bacterium]
MNNVQTTFVRLFVAALLLPVVAFAQDRCAPLDDMPAMQINASPFLKGGTPGITGQWSTGAKLPIAKVYHTVASLDGVIYIFGGVTTGNAYNAKSYKYTIATDTWAPIKDFPIARFLVGTAQAVNGKIYIMAGLDNLGTSYKVVPDVYEYNPANDTYTKKANMPSAQAYCPSAVFDNKIYLIGGSSTANTTYQKTVRVYDPATDTWSTATDYPRALKYHAAAQIGNRVVVTGGYNNENPQMTYVADTYVGEYAAGTLTWTKVKDYPIGPTIFMAGVGIGQNAYFFGGRPSIDNNAPATQRSFKYDPATDTWSTLDLKPTGAQMVTQAATDGVKGFYPGGGDAAGGVLDKLEIFDANASGGPVLALDSKVVDTWIKKTVPVVVNLGARNNGSANLTWNATVDAGSQSWLSLPGAAGAIAPMTKDVLRLQINAGSLANGTHTGTVTMTTNDPNQASVAITVTIHVQDQDVDEAPIALIEEGTGTWCGFCPYGADSLKAVIERNNGKVVGISYHGGSATEPMFTPTTDTWATKTGLAGWPNGAVNRILFEGNPNICFSRGDWARRAEEVLATRRSPVGIRVKTATLNPATKMINMDVEVFFHRDFTRPVRLNIAQVQDQMNYQQVFYPPAGGTTRLYPYFHDHVLRAMHPNDFGEVISSANIVSQTSVVKSFSFPAIDTVLSLTRLIIFAHVSDGVNFGEVLQAQEIQVASMVTSAGTAPSAETFTLAQNYPNPFNPTTTISFGIPAAAHVRIAVSDAFGRELGVVADGSYDAGTHSTVFNAAGLASGTYYVTMRSGSFVQTRTMSLLK